MRQVREKSVKNRSKKRVVKPVRAWAIVGCDGTLCVKTVSQTKPNLEAPFTKLWVEMGARIIRVEIHPTTGNRSTKRTSP